MYNVLINICSLLTFAIQKKFKAGQLITNKGSDISKIVSMYHSVWCPPLFRTWQADGRRILMHGEPCTS